MNQKLWFRQMPVWVVGASLWATIAGCGSPDTEFRFNEAHLIKFEEGLLVDDSAPAVESGIEPYDAVARRRLQQNVADILVAVFGTPDDPQVPPVEGVEIDQLLDLERLQLAAGPVSSDRTGAPSGLYREHCAHCHGVTGDGRGPTSQFLNPYPRDYRMGVYKFKSTPAKDPPRHEDLKRILVDGIPGTAMPSFKLLPDYQLEALIHYVRYLSIRGQVERRLIEDSVEYFPDPLVDPAGDDAAVQSQMGVVLSTVEEFASAWLAAEQQASAVPAAPADFDSPEAIERGRALFHGNVANCYTCHGETALGDGQVNDYDDWTKEYFNKDAPEQFVRYLEADAVLEPRNIRPRNLRMNVYRGGRRPIDVYWRVLNGIAGGPMPAAAMRPAGAGDDDPRLTPNDLWDIVSYVRSVPFEALSQPAPAPSFQRDRQ